MDIEFRIYRPFRKSLNIPYRLKAREVEAALTGVYKPGDTVKSYSLKINELADSWNDPVKQMLGYDALAQILFSDSRVKKLRDPKLDKEKKQAMGENASAIFRHLHNLAIKTGDNRKEREYWQKKQELESLAEHPAKRQSIPKYQEVLPTDTLKEHNKMLHARYKSIDYLDERGISQIDSLATLAATVEFSAKSEENYIYSKIVEKSLDRVIAESQSSLSKMRNPKKRFIMSLTMGALYSSILKNAGVYQSGDVPTVKLVLDYDKAQKFVELAAGIDIGEVGRINLKGIIDSEKQGPVILREGTLQKIIEKLNGLKNPRLDELIDDFKKRTYINRVILEDAKINMLKQAESSAFETAYYTAKDHKLKAKDYRLCRAINRAQDFSDNHEKHSWARFFAKRHAEALYKQFKEEKNWNILGEIKGLGKKYHIHVSKYTWRIHTYNTRFIFFPRL